MYGEKTIFKAVLHFYCFDDWNPFFVFDPEIDHKLYEVKSESHSNSNMLRTHPYNLCRRPHDQSLIHVLTTLL